MVFNVMFCASKMGVCFQRCSVEASSTAGRVHVPGLLDGCLSMHVHPALIISTPSGHNPTPLLPHT